MKADSLDLEILETYKELNPSAAYLQGFNQYAGKLFIPSSENIRGALERVRELRRRAKTELQEKVLDSFEVALLFDEPQPILDDIVGTIFNTVIKEGVVLTADNPGHYGSQAVDLAPAQGAIVEFTTAEDGMYPIVTHAFNFVGRGAIGVFMAGDGDPTE